MDANTDGHQAPIPDARKAAHRHTWVIIAVDKAQCQQCQLIVPLRVEEGPERPQE